MLPTSCFKGNRAFRGRPPEVAVSEEIFTTSWGRGGGIKKVGSVSETWKGQAGGQEAKRSLPQGPRHVDMPLQNEYE
jgi:hypothetical protein